MNKSPILSGVIISILAIVGSQFMKIYTYIYWLPYFRFFKIPMYYFDIVIFDRYTIICKIILIILIMMVQKKIKKGDSIAKIADGLVEDEIVISPIYKMVKEYPEDTRLFQVLCKHKKLI